MKEENEKKKKKKKKEEEIANGNVAQLQRFQFGNVAPFQLCNVTIGCFFLFFFFFFIPLIYIVN
jgi:hypothetical protein